MARFGANSYGKISTDTYKFGFSVLKMSKKCLFSCMSTLSKF